MRIACFDGGQDARNLVHRSRIRTGNGSLRPTCEQYTGCLATTPALISIGERVTVSRIVHRASNPKLSARLFAGCARPAELAAVWVCLFRARCSRLESELACIQ